MVYMVGDNDLERYVTRDIRSELGIVGSNADVNVLVLADRSPGYSIRAANWTSTKLFYVTKGMKPNPEAALADWGECNMGDPQTLVDFISLARSDFPAERYVLVMWNHGWGWRPYQTMWDETNDDTLDMHEMAVALEQTGTLDVIAYDACLMQDIEVLATLRPYASVVAASQDYVGYEGFRYEEVLRELEADTGMSNEALGVCFASSMRDRTSSAVVLNDDFDSLVKAVDAWSQVLAEGQSAWRGQYAKAYLMTQNFGDPLFVDLYDAALQIKACVSDVTLQNASQAVMDAINRVALFEWHRNFYRGANGISIFWPQNEKGLDEPSSPQWNDFAYYRDFLLFGATTHWDEFLYSYATSRPRAISRKRILSRQEQLVEAVKYGAPGLGLPAARGYYSPAKKGAIQYTQ